jgi:3-hydroxyacyl-CoA dehydrogenase/enoyl-CoA hydratase/3-hydroxybutyryl-CoA epimerase
MGKERFVELCRTLERKHGARFAPCALLLDMAKAGDSFYGRFAPAARQAA